MALAPKPQRGVAQRRRHAVAGKRAVIETDPQIAGFRQDAGDRFGLAMPFETVGQQRLFYLTHVS
jgi:hypothetical protein